MSIEWYQNLTIAALILSAIWPICQFIIYVKGPKLNLRLSKDFFFRVSTNFGECLFSKPVLLAENGNILVERVTGKLTSLNSGSKKDWELEFSNFGELVRDPNAIFSNHYFYSTSPLRYLIKDKPVLAVYMGGLKGYSREFLEKVKEMRNVAYEIRKDLPVSLARLNEANVFNQLSEEDRAYINSLHSKI